MVVPAGEGLLHAHGDDRREPGGVRQILERPEGDIARLTQLVSILRRRDDDEGLALLMEAASRLASAKRATGIDDRDHLTRFLSRRSLIRGNGQPLHRYRTTEEEFAGLRSHLIERHKLGKLETASPHDGAIFVLFGAEWFRRSFTGGVASWRTLTDVIGALNYGATVELTREGLAWWRRPVRRMNGENHWLHTLRLEGGFPSRLLESQESGWITSHLRRLITAASSVSAEVAEEEMIALALVDEGVPRTFRTADFAVLCAELTVTIVALRRQHGAKAAAAGMRLSAWLDASEPSWRTELTIEGDGATRLLDNLVSDNLQKLGGDGARCRRMLIRDNGAWQPALRLGVDGELTSIPQIKLIRSRLHVYPKGLLADMIAGAVSVLEPSDDGGPWLVRPRAAAPRDPILGFPFEAAVRLELRIEGRAVSTVTWPGGDPVRAEVLTFVADDDDRPRCLDLVATGSCRNRRPVLFVSAPAGFAATLATGGPITPLWSGGGRQLLRVVASTHVGLATSSLFYRIDPAADKDEADRLVIRGDEMRGATTCDGEPIYAGAPEIRKQANTVLAQGQDDLFWRKVGEREWRDIRRSSITPGVIEIMWRDPASRAARDRRRLAILPEASELQGQPLKNGGARFDLRATKGWRVLSTVTTTALISDIESGNEGCAWQMSWRGAETRSVTFRLSVPGGTTIDVMAPFPMRTGRFLRPDGTSFPDNAPITLDRLKGSRAVASGRAVLWIETHGPGQQGSHRLAFDDEVALWSLRDIISALLAEAGDLDSEAWISFAPTGLRLRVKRYEAELTPIAGGLRLPTSSTDLGKTLTLRWRSLADMGPEGARELAEIPPTTRGAVAQVALPLDLPGPGVAYLSGGGLTISRPILVSRTHPNATDHTPLRRAVMIAERRDRETAFDAALWAIGIAPQDSEADLAWLHDHLAIPEALAPSTFQVFNALAHHSRALAALVAAAPDDAARDRAWKLERELPLLWALVGVEDWRAAFAAKRSRVQQQIEAAGLMEHAARLAKEATENAAERFVSFDETLRVTFWAAGLVRPPAKLNQSGKLIAQDFIRRLVGGSESGSSTSCFHTAALAPHLHPLCPWIHDFDQSHHEALEAPIVAALVAGGRVSTLEGAARLRIREAMIQDPQHFADAYAAALVRTGRSA